MTLVRFPDSRAGGVRLSGTRWAKVHIGHWFPDSDTGALAVAPETRSARRSKTGAPVVGARQIVTGDGFGNLWRNEIG